MYACISSTLDYCVLVFHPESTTLAFHAIGNSFQPSAPVFTARNKGSNRIIKSELYPQNNVPLRILRIAKTICTSNQHQSRIFASSQTVVRNSAYDLDRGKDWLCSPVRILQGLAGFDAESRLRSHFFKSHQNTENR